MVENRNNRLDSWKEIAEYLGRDIRTAIRWEQEKGLPVHRVPGGKRQLVFGFSDEIDAWLKNGASHPLEKETPQNGAAPGQSTQVANPPGEPRVLPPRRARHVVWGGIGLVLLALLCSGGYEWVRWRTHQSAGPLERQLTANPPEDRVRGAAISPDGKHLAYRDEDGLFVRAVDSGETRTVPLPPELRPFSGGILQWFPDGGKLLAEVSTPKGTAVWVFPILGAAPPHLLLALGGQPAISPDGRSLAYLNGDVATGARELWVCGINGESPRKLATSDQNFGLWSPVWSPDGRWIAYWRNTGTHPSSVAIEVQPAGGGPARTLVPESSLPKTDWLLNGAAMSWSPDWRLIWAITEASGTPGGSQGDTGLWALPVDPTRVVANGKLERLARWNDWLTVNLSITADGRRLALLRLRPRDDVYVGELERDGSSIKAPHRFTLDTRGNEVDGWTPDSQAIIFGSCRNAKWEILKQGMHENVSEKVIESSGQAWNAAVSPDKVWYLYWEELGGPAHQEPSPGRLMRRPVAGGSPEMVLQEPDNDLLDFQCARNPTATCVLSRREGKEMVFYSLDPVRGKGDRIAHIEVRTGLFSGTAQSDWSVSPDGSRLAVVGARPAIAVFTRSDRTWHEVSVESGVGLLRAIRWAADGQSFYASNYLLGSYDLLHVTAAGKVQRLFRKVGSRVSDPRPSPDGKHLEFSVQTWDSNVWMIENF